MSDPDQLSVSLLGPVTVRSGDLVVPIGGEIPRAIVARLALTPGEYVTPEELIHDIWGDAPETILSSLRAHVSRLRSGVLGDAMQGGRRGYMLQVDDDHVDAARFSELVAGAVRPGVAEPESFAALSEAEAMWLGDPLADLDTFPFLHEARAQLHDDRRRAGEALAELRLARGDHAIAALGIEAVVDANPLHERPVALLATAYARTGRTSDALRAIDDFSQRLADAQGLDPTPELRDLRSAIVRQDPEVLGTSRGTESAVQRTGVPIPLTRLVGRRADIKALARARTQSRLTTVVGTAGVGKTRLVTEVARQATTDDDDEQWMADLTTVDDRGGVLAVVADLVGAAGHDIDAIGTRLRGRRALLVLDNAEHVLPAARELVEGLLSRVEGLTVMVTSREPLRIAGERLVRLDGLEGDDRDDAVELFAQRAADADPLFELTAETVGRVTEICRMLDGVPLALELAASRLDALTLDELAESIAKDAGLGTPGADRHGSLASAIAWSTSRLTAAERDLLAQLARFVGPFTVDAVEGICVGLDRASVRELLIALVQKSLVAVTDSGTGQRRYRLLESIRQVVRAETDAVDDAAWSARHRAWMGGFALQRAALVTTRDARSAHAELDAARPDLSAALDSAIAASDRTAAMMLVAGQAMHWFHRGLLAEGVRAASRAFEVPGETDPFIEARANLGAMLLSYQTGDAQTAFGHTRRAAAIANANDDIDAEAVALSNDAYGLSLFGEAEAAEQLMTRALELADRSTDDGIKAQVLMGHGQMLRGLGKPAAALETLGKAHELAAGVGYQWIATSATYIVGKVLIDVRRGREAVGILRNGAVQALVAEDPTSALALLHALAAATSAVERHAVGATVLGAVDRIGERYSYNPLTAEGAEAQGYRDRVRAGLSEEAFERAYAHGRTLSFGEVLELVRGLPA
ncbi:MAG TPA: BTAD domain-containing putative transcriptional regulator [Rhodoglobus sp.]|nr:BTAD domain-containing putative transcriptional regulator [Rhodoglobus sp.]